MKSLLPCVVSLALSLCVLTGCNEEVVEKEDEEESVVEVVDMYTRM
jgi:hypothetical protein